MNNKIVVISIAAVIGIIVLGSVLMPILNDATAKEDSFTNEGYYRMSHYDATTDHTFSWTYENPNYVTVDGVDVKVGGAINMSVTVVADTNWLVRVNTNSSGNVSGVSIIMPTGGTTSATVSNSTTATMTFNSGSMSATFGDSEKSGTYADLWLPSNDGEYIMKNSGIEAYINGDSELVAYGLTRVKNNAGNTTSSPGFGISMIGDYDNGVTYTIWRDANNNTISDISVNVTKMSDHVDLYKISSITGTFTLAETVDGETVYTDTPITYNYFIVPYEISAERSIHFTDGQNAIFAAIPVMIILAVLLAVVALVIRSRMD